MKNKNILRKVGFFFLFALIGVAIGYTAGKAFAVNNSGIPMYYKILLIPLLFLSMLGVIALHELGHISGGWISGFHFQMLTVGPFAWLREGKKIVFRWNTNLNAYGGLALSLPQDAKNLVKRFLIFILGGPLSSLICGLTSLVVHYWFFTSNLRQNLPGFLSANFLFITGSLSLLIFLVTVLPYRSGTFYSDGARIWNMLKGGEQAKLETILLITIGQSAGGIRPAHLNISALEEALELKVNSIFQTYVHAYLYYAYLDRKEISKAESHLEAFYQDIENIPEAYQANVYLEKAYYIALFKKDPFTAQEYFDLAKINPFIPKNYPLRAKAAIALSNGKYEEARQWVAQAIEELPKSMEKGMAVAEKEWLEEIREVAEKREAAEQVAG